MSMALGIFVSEDSFPFLQLPHIISPWSSSLSISPFTSTGRALQRAAAAAAVERARRARMAQGGAAKGGGGKGKGAQEVEEECSICQSEFTVQGDGGEYFVDLQ